ncbi:MAG: DUF234 domain-containing protein, partial [Bdellovibrionales bacterium]
NKHTINQSIKLNLSCRFKFNRVFSSFNLLFFDENLLAPSRINRSGFPSRYILKDFFLNFYFTVYQNYLTRIQKNTSGKDLVFADLLNKNGYYIENFTGKAFENLMRYELEGPNPNAKLLKMLKLHHADFFVGTHSTKETQLDLVVLSDKDRLVRVLECKWGQENISEIEQLCQKPCPLLPTQKRLNIIIKAQKPSQAYQKKCLFSDVLLITLDQIL